MMVRALSRRTKRLWLSAVGASLLLSGVAVTACSVAVVSCWNVAEGDVVESNEFTPYESRLTHVPERPMLAGNAEPNLDAGDASVPSNKLDGLPLQWVSDGSGGTYQVFLDRPIDAELTISAFTSASGIRYNRLPIDGGDDFVPYMLGEFPSRAVPVEIGGHPGVLTWGDPDANGVRPHHLYWSDGVYGYVLIAERSAASIVNLGRDLACRV